MSEQPTSKPPVTITFPDGKTASTVVNFLVKKRPAGWSRRSYATYYKQVYAEWIKRDIDKMIETRQKAVYRYDSWPKLKPTALYQRINQAIMFLLDESNQMDPDGRYAKWRNDIRIHRRPDIGVVMEYDEVLEGSPAAEFVSADMDKPKWMQRMDEYLESRDPDLPPFHQTGLMLTPDEIVELKEELAGLQGIMFSVDSREVKIIKG